MTDSSPQAKAKTKTKVKIVAAFLVASFVASYTLVNVKKNHQLMVDGRRLNAAISEPIEWIETFRDTLKNLPPISKNH